MCTREIFDTTQCNPSNDALALKIARKVHVSIMSFVRPYLGLVLHHMLMHCEVSHPMVPGRHCALPQ